MGAEHNLLRTQQQAIVRYYDNYSLTGTLGLPAVQVFSVNGMYDPDISGIGHQPRGFDELMALYDRFQVDETLIEVEWSAPIQASYNSTSGNQVLVGISLLEGSTAKTTARDYIESRIEDHTVMVPTNGARKLKLTVKANEFLGLPKRGEHGLTGSNAANPAYMCYFHIWAVGVDGAAASAVDATVKITYKTNLTEPKEPASS
jgi:hypothetical protein